MMSGSLKIVYVNPSDLRTFDGNPRTISDAGLEKLQRSIEGFGFTNPVLAQKSTNMIIAGHQRLKAAKVAGLTEVPVVYLDMDDTTAKAYNVADNRLTEESEWDFGPLADLLQELDTGAFDMALTGFDGSEIEQLMTWTPEPEMKDLEEPSFVREQRQIIIIVDSETDAAAVGRWAERQGYEWHVQVVPLE